MIGVTNSIVELPRLVETLSQEDRDLFNGIFKVVISDGGLHIPDTMQEWVEKQFGSVDAVMSQMVVRVMNLVTCEDALFNPLRLSRPLNMRNGASMEEMIRSGAPDPLGSPTELTPADLFGRIKGRHSITAANVAKVDGFSGLVVFENYNPLEFSKDDIEDYLDVGLQWAEEAHRLDPGARYYFFLWNCLWRSGASLVHGHAQVVLGRGAHYGKIEHLRRCAAQYRKDRGRDYFRDLIQVHRALGLALDKEDVTIMAYATPTKEREVLLIAPNMRGSLKGCVYEVLRCFRDNMGVTSFNLALYMPPLGPALEEWGGFPTVVRIVDRGDPSLRTSDMGGMELYACPVVSMDPFQVAVALRENIP